MKGTLLSFETATGAGLIRAEDGKRYSFNESSWMDTVAAPTVGQSVDFEVQDGSAKEIIVLRLEAPASAVQTQASQAASNGTLLGTISIVCALLVLFPGFGWFFMFVAAFCGVLGRMQAKKTGNATGARLAALGLALTLVTVLINLLILVFLGAALFGGGLR